MSDGISTTSLSLMARIRRHDQHAWNRLVDIYGPLVFGWCRQRGLREHDASDVGQLVFSDVARRITVFRRENPGDSFRKWLKAITDLKIKDHYRNREGAIGGTAHHDLVAGLPAATEGDVDTDAEGASEHAAVVRRALNLIRVEFEERTWQAFWRTAVDGQSAPAIAEELEMTPVAVRKAKSRVLARLRRELEELVDF